MEEGTSTDSEAVEREVQQKKSKRRSTKRLAIVRNKRKKIPKKIFTPASIVKKKKNKNLKIKLNKRILRNPKLGANDNSSKENLSTNSRQRDVVKLKNLSSAKNLKLNYGSPILSPVHSDRSPAIPNEQNNEHGSPVLSSTNSDRSPALTNQQRIGHGSPVLTPTNSDRGPALTNQQRIGHGTPILSPTNSDRRPAIRNLNPISEENRFPRDNYDCSLLPVAEEDNRQLLGPNFQNDTMVHLKNNIFCTRSVLDEIESRCHSGTGVARLLMVGVFNPRSVCSCTLTGRSGTRRIFQVGDKFNIQSLHNVARETIVAFAKFYAARRGWVAQSNKTYHRAMTRKLGEMRRDHVIYIRKYV